ncbi:MAG: peptidyl-prolyl cis-trans isomerase [Deltaproteobacteria bacterium]|nr:peptidyl-prolyl cis-trans isomerase [Deltaproteobacteria bacterium]
MLRLTHILSLAIATLLTLPSCSHSSNPEPKGGPVLVLSTSMGDIKIALYEKEAPETVKNFLAYVNDKFYDGTVFHRVIPGFMIQGGGFTPDMQQKPTKSPVKNEAANGLKNEVGTLAMARTPDPHSATAQFFINVKNNDFLDYKDSSMQGFGYCVFGKVVEGMDIVRKIELVKTANKGGHQNVPIDAITINSVSVVPDGK